MVDACIGVFKCIGIAGIWVCVIAYGGLAEGVLWEELGKW